MRKNKRMFVDSFDHDASEPQGLRGVELDKHILSTAKRVSCFWITETDARASRITNWIKRGILVTDNSIGYPWVKVVSFDASRA